MNKDEMKVYEKGYADGQAHAIDTMNYIFHDEGIKIRKETAREILQDLNNRYNECGGAVDVAIMLYDWLSEMSKKYGIELE